MDIDRNIWADFGPVIKQLYQDERKSLKEIKAILEGQHGFPETPLTTYQLKLRETCKLRKKFKNGDWPVIDNYTRAEGFDDFDLYLNGTLISREKAWKEIRRSRVRGGSLPTNGPITLPYGIEIRRRSASLARQLPSPVRLPVCSPLPTAESRVPASVDYSGPLIQDNDNMLGDIGDLSFLDDLALLPSAAPFSTEDSVQVHWDRTGTLDIQNSWVSVVEPRQSPTPQRYPAEVVTGTLDMSVDTTSMVPWSPNVNNTATSQVSGHSSQSAAPIVTAQQMARYRYLFARTCLETIPWNQYRLELQSMRNGGRQIAINYQEIDGWALSLMPADGFFGHVPSGLPVLISDTRYPTINDVEDSISSSRTIAINFDPFKLLAQAVYLFSNRLEMTDDTVLELLDTLAHRVRPSIVFGIFKSSSASIRATWEVLLRIGMRHRHKARNGLRLLVNVAVRCQPRWVDETHDLIFAALSSGDIGLVQHLLDKGQNPAYCSLEGMPFEQTGYSVAAASGATDCAQLLIKYCHPNNVIAAPSRTMSSVSIFSAFLQDLLYKMASDDVHVSRNLSAYLETLGSMLDVDVNVDTANMIQSHELHNELINSAKSWRAYAVEWRISCLDFSFYWVQSIFDILLPYSHRSRVELTRSGICMAALHGQDRLAGYLELHSPPPAMTAERCLEITLADQFSPGRYIYFKPLATQRIRTARVLVEYGVRIREQDEDHNKFLRNVVMTAVRAGIQEDLTFLLDHLLSAGARISGGALAQSIEGTGTDVLELLIQRGADVASNGQRALLEAAIINNYDAVSLLLKMGVDINSEFTPPQSWFPSTALARLMTDTIPRRGSDCQTSIKMWRFFVDNGAKLRLGSTDTNCYELLVSIFTIGGNSTWEAFNFLLQFEGELDELSPLQWSELIIDSLSPRRVWPDWRIVEALIQRCKRYGPTLQPNLSMLILHNCPAQIVMDLIAAGQSINGYWKGYTPLQAAALRLNYEMASHLLRLGADINRLNTTLGGTPLQLACLCSPCAEEMGRQKHMVKLLVAHGADVNAPAHGRDGRTALQSICLYSTRTQDAADHSRWLILFLLERGANGNAVPGLMGETALHLCVGRGDLDMATILVQHGVDLNGVPTRHIDLSMPCLYSWFSVLDTAAYYGRLDMTQYLLNAGALSATPGTSGFQGAIDHAVYRVHHAVAEVIREHVEKVTILRGENPDMALAHQRCVERHTLAVQARKAEYQQERRNKQRRVRES